MAKIVKQIGNIDKNLHKQEIVNLAKENAQAILDNENYDLIKVYIELKRYESYLKGLISHLKESTLKKATEIGSKSFEYDEARVSIQKRTIWDFSIDEKWSELDKKIMTLTKEKKEREEFLKSNKIVKIIVDKNTGEILEEFELPKEINYGIFIKL